MRIDQRVLRVVLHCAAQFNVGVFLRFGPVRIYIPLEVSNLQFKVTCSALWRGWG